MKKYFYIFCFTLLGFLLQFIVHGVGEWIYTILLFRDYQFWSFGMRFETIYAIHHAATVGLMGAGIVFGFLMGRYFWPILYDENGNIRLEVLLRWGKKEHK